MSHLLEIDGLRIELHTEQGVVRAVDEVDLHVDQGELVALVGESGSGKSMTALSILGLVPGASSVTGSVRYDGTEIVGASDATLRRIRGMEIAMVFQNPMSSLNPLQRVGSQIVEQIRIHKRVGRRDARERAAELLRRVGIADADRRMRSYPHEFSGGMRQRVMIAMSLACGPRILVADEPTTGLDVTVQAQILRELDELRRTLDMAVVLITHDLAVVSQIADRVAVMYSGRVVETGRVADVFRQPQHPYTWGLLGSIPRLSRPREAALVAIPGQPPPGDAWEAGCAFAARCAHVFESCDRTPALVAQTATPEHLDRCWLPDAQKRQLWPHGEDVRSGAAGGSRR